MKNWILPYFTIFALYKNDTNAKNVKYEHD